MEKSAAAVFLENIRTIGVSVPGGTGRTRDGTKTKSSAQRRVEA
jgi:hypothetical protein